MHAQAERAAKADAVATEAAAAQQAAVHEADVGDDERAAAFAQQMQAKARGHAKRAEEDGNDPADTHEDGHASGDEQGDEQANKRAKASFAPDLRCTHSACTHTRPDVHSAPSY